MNIENLVDLAVQVTYNWGVSDRRQDYFHPQQKTDFPLIVILKCEMKIRVPQQNYCNLQILLQSATLLTLSFLLRGSSQLSKTKNSFARSNAMISVNNPAQHNSL